MTKLGMLGELLCHVLLFYFRKEFSAASPFFNMEEGSIKKGFDIIVSNGTKGELWITEIKSGEVGASEKDEKVRSLIDKARLDLLDRIASDNTTIWHGAINNVELALASSQPSKSTLIKYLDEFLEGAQNLSNQSSKANVILAPILFEDTKNPIDPAVVSTKAKSIIESSSFNKSVIFAIQKSTISRLEEFLNDEAAAAP